MRDKAPRVVDLPDGGEGWAIGELTTSRPVIPNPIGSGEVRMATIRFKPEAGPGILVAAARRADFPTEIEMLLLRAATNNATIVLQESQLSRGQRRAAR